MLIIKLKRIGKKHQASFRIIVTEKRSKMTGRYVEDLGFWNPHKNQLGAKKDRIQYWIKSGAQTTETIHNLLVKNGIIQGHKIPAYIPKSAPAETAPVQKTPAGPEQPSAETQ